jgi:hypothetical protein
MFDITRIKYTALCGSSIHKLMIIWTIFYPFPPPPIHPKPAALFEKINNNSYKNWYGQCDFFHIYNSTVFLLLMVDFYFIFSANMKQKATLHNKQRYCSNKNKLLCTFYNIASCRTSCKTCINGYRICTFVHILVPKRFSGNTFVQMR